MAQKRIPRVWSKLWARELHSTTVETPYPRKAYGWFFLSNTAIFSFWIHYIAFSTVPTSWGNLVEDLTCSGEVIKAKIRLYLRDLEKPMGVYFPISLDFGQFFDDFSTFFNEPCVYFTLFDSIQTLKAIRTSIQFPENGIFR